MRNLCLLLSVFYSFSLLAAPRVISLSPAITEMAFLAGMGDQLVGVSSYSDYPLEAKKIEPISDWQGINVERVIALKPDLLLAWRGGNPQRILDQLLAFGIPVLYLENSSLEDIPKNLERLARYSEHPEQAQLAAVDFRATLKKLRLQYQTLSSHRAFLQFGAQSLLTSAHSTLQSQAVTVCGIENIFADSPVSWPQVGREQVLMRKPALIITPNTPEHAAAIRAFWGAQLQIPIIMLNEDWFNRESPRILLAIESLCQQVAMLDHAKN